MIQEELGGVIIECDQCLMNSAQGNFYLTKKGKCNYCEDGQANRIRRREFVLSDNELLDWMDKSFDISNTRSVIGLSGGIDSSFLVYLLANYQIKPIVFHVDAGWNSPVAIRNIEALVNSLGLDFYTKIVNWHEMKALQKAFLHSGVINQDAPQDHIFFAELFSFAKKHRIKTVLTGHNRATENISPPKWRHPAMDGKNVRSIAQNFGVTHLSSLKFRSNSRHIWETRIYESFRVLSPLARYEYSETAAKLVLSKIFKWQDYGGKHRESIFTEFLQEVYFPIRFGIEKSRWHLSDLIHNGEISYLEAKSRFNATRLSRESEENLKTYVSDKLEIERQEFETLLKLPINDFRNFKNDVWLDILLEKTKSFRKTIGLRREM